MDFPMGRIIIPTILLKAIISPENTFFPTNKNYK